MTGQRAARFAFLLAGVALAALVITVFLWVGAAQAPEPPFQPVLHQECGQPVALRAEDYNLWGSTRHDIELARLDFCDPVRVLRADGRLEVWFWLEVAVTGQVFPYAGWGFPWQDVATPFPADDREPRNPWWEPRSSLRAVPNELGYTGGDGVVCPLAEAQQRGLDLFFYREGGFQLPVGVTHRGWVCLYFDNGQSVPDAFTVTVRPERARITQWVDKLLVATDRGLHDVPAMPFIEAHDLCAHARQTHPATVRPGERCDDSPEPDTPCCQ